MALMLEDSLVVCVYFGMYKLTFRWLGPHQTGYLLELMVVDITTLGCAFLFMESLNTLVGVTHGNYVIIV